MLNDEDRETLVTWEREGLYSCPHEGDRCPTPIACRNEFGLFAAVESIVAAKQAEALRDAASYFWNRPTNAELTEAVTALVFAELNQLADEHQRGVGA